MNKLSVIVAIYKDEENILPFYDDFCSNIKPFLDDYELIFVNDASPDGAWDVLKDLAKVDNKVRLIKHSRNFGAMAACFTGIKHSSGDCVTVKACDLQEPPELTVEMYNRWKEGRKVLLAVREERDDPRISKFFSELYYRLVRKIVTDKMPQGGFDIYLIDRQIADHIVCMNEANSPITLQLLWLGFDYMEILYKRKKRERGRSTWTFVKKIGLFMDSFIGFSYVPIRIMALIGLLFSLFSVIMGIDVIVEKLMGKIPVPGYTAIFVLLLFSSGLIMLTLGLLGEYLWRTLDSVRRRPVAVVEEMINF